MLDLKLAIQLKSLKMPFKQALLTAHQLGAKAVEIDARGDIRPQDLTNTAVRQLKKTLEDLHLRVAAVGFHTRRGYNAVEDLDARVEATKAAMKMAQVLGAPVVVNQVGRVPTESQGRDWDMLVEVLRDLGLQGQRIGATLAAETGSERGPDLARLIAALPEGSLAVTFDPGNLMINGFSPQEAVEALGPHILHVHANDGVRDLANGRGIHVRLGDGACDFPSLLATLEEHSYRGYLTLERQAGNDPVGDIAAGMKYLWSL
ncbi:MAG: sugar phosphate isomerase/epimerase family protein [Pirellulales bacterium]